MRWFLLLIGVKFSFKPLGAEEQKFDLTNYYLLDFILVPSAPVSWDASSHIALAFLSRLSLAISFVDARKRNLSKSRHNQEVCGQTQSIVKVVRYPLGFTAIGCLHKRRDLIKPKDLSY